MTLRQWGSVCFPDRIFLVCKRKVNWWKQFCNSSEVGSTTSLYLLLTFLCHMCKEQGFFLPSWLSPPTGSFWYWWNSNNKGKDKTIFIYIYTYKYIHKSLYINVYFCLSFIYFSWLMFEATSFLGFTEEIFDYTSAVILFWVKCGFWSWGFCVNHVCKECSLLPRSQIISIVCQFRKKKIRTRWESFLSVPF